MAPRKKDPTEPIRLKASRYAEVDEGTACTQSAFKTHKGAFLYIGEQGGRYKAMFKLQTSMSEAARLAKKDPNNYDVGSTAWVTARFSADEPMPKKLWEKWLDESYALSVAHGAGRKPAAKKARKNKAIRTKPKRKAVKKT